MLLFRIFQFLYFLLMHYMIVASLEMSDEPIFCLNRA